MKISKTDPRAATNPSLSRNILDMTDINETPESILEGPWSPIVTTNNYLKEENFHSCGLLVFDIDNDPTSQQLRLDDALSLFKDYWHILATTRNHQVIKTLKSGKTKPAADRYRLILAFDKEINDLTQYKNLWNFYALALNLKKVADPLKDGARFYYASKEIISMNRSGKKLTTNIQVENRVGRGPKLDLTKAEKEQIRDYIPKVKGKISRRTMEFLAQQPSHESWHHRFYTAALDLKTQGYSQDEAAEELTKASPEGALDQTDIDQLEDVYLNDRGEPGNKREPWPDMVTKEDKNGDVIQYPEKNSYKNCRYLIQSVMKLQLRLDSRMNLIEVGPEKYIKDSDISKIAEKARDFNLGLTRETINDVINNLADENTFDPLIESIEKYRWDGKSRFKELLNTISFPEDVTKEDLILYEMFLRKWLIGVVTKIYKPGSENNMLVFVGAQGAGKTRWFRRLAEIYPRGFIEAHINTDDKDSHLNLLKYFIWSVSELDTVTWSKDVGALKDFITKSEVRARPAYARHEIIGSSITSFCASVNSRDFLHDTTGNRRYLIMLVEEVNASHNIDIGQVFAEAKVLMEKGERAWFDRKEIEIVNRYNERFISRSDFLEAFEARVSEGELSLSLKEILEELDITNAKNSDRRSIRDWLTKRGIKEVNHSNVKKYYVSIKSLSGTKAAAALKKTMSSRLDTLKNPIKQDIQ